MSSQSSYSGPAARRYAKALFHAALEAGALEAVAADVDALGAAFGDAELGAWLADPRVEDADKQKALEKLGESCHGLTRGLFHVLVRRRRHAVLTELPQAFLDLLDEHQDRVRGVLETAKPLTDDDRARIESSFSARTGRTVVLETRDNPELLGGVRVTLGGTRYDGSARGRLEKLRARLAQADLGNR